MATAVTTKAVNLYQLAAVDLPGVPIVTSGPDATGRLAIKAECPQATLDAALAAHQANPNYKPVVDPRPGPLRYISPDGDDNAPGTQREPMRTPRAALASLNGPGLVHPLPGVYDLLQPAVVKERQGIVAEVGDTNLDSPGVIFRPAAGFSGPGVIVSESFLNPNAYAHFIRLENFSIDARGSGVAGVVVNGLGEESVLRRLFVAADSGKPAYWLTGTHAVGHVEDCSAWGGPFKLEAHPTFTSGPAVGSVGSVRFIGISGDANSPALIHAAGKHVLDIIGLKWEHRANPDDCCILLEDNGVAVTRQRLRISGYADASSSGGLGGGDFIRIIKGKPSVLVEGTQAAHFTNLVNDTVTGTVIPSENETAPVFLAYGAWAGEQAVFQVPKVKVANELWVAGKKLVLNANGTVTWAAS